MDILDFLLGAAVGIALYHAFLSFMAHKFFRDLARARGLLEENKEGEEEVINANIEEHNNQFLFYFMILKVVAFLFYFILLLFC
jgi:hypothetical protein